MFRLLILPICGLLSTHVLAEPSTKINITKIDNKQIGTEPGQRELSGLVRSRTYDNLWWAHNDSGNSPVIFPLDANGRVIQYKKRKRGKNKYGGRHKHGGIPVELAANIDWEDIAIDKGLIYIADTGNNYNARRDLGIIVLAEPNPFYTERIRAQKYIPVQFPEQLQFPADKWYFDSESLFVSDEHLYLLTKHRTKDKNKTLIYGTNLYQLSLTSARNDQVNMLEKIDSHNDIYAPTGADISPDGKPLAVLTYKKLWVFTKPSAGKKWLSANPDTTLSVTLPSNIGQAEAISWDTDTTMTIINEKNRDFFRVNISNSR